MFLSEELKVKQVVLVNEKSYQDNLHCCVEYNALISSIILSLAQWTYPCLPLMRPCDCSTSCTRGFTGRKGSSSAEKKNPTYKRPGSTSIPLRAGLTPVVRDTCSLHGKSTNLPPPLPCANVSVFTFSIRWGYWCAPCCRWTQRENTRFTMADYFSFPGKIWRWRIVKRTLVFWLIQLVTENIVHVRKRKKFSVTRPAIPSREIYVCRNLGYHAVWWQREVKTKQPTFLLTIQLPLQTCYRSMCF